MVKLKYKLEFTSGNLTLVYYRHYKDFVSLYNDVVNKILDYSNTYDSLFFCNVYITVFQRDFLYNDIDSPHYQYYMSVVQTDGKFAVLG